MAKVKKALETRRVTYGQVVLHKWALFVAQNKAAMLTTDFWLAAGHALDVFAQVRRARRPRSSAGVHPGVFCNRARARSRSGGRLHIRR